MAREAVSLEADLAGLVLRLPVIAAAGTAGVLDELADVLDLRDLGAVVTKSITREPRDGNRPWRITGVRGGMLNAIGLANPGVEAFAREYGPRIAGMGTRVIVSVAGNTVEDYAAVAQRVGAIEGVGGVEVNVSCPNVHGGSDFATDVGALRELVGEVRRVCAARVFVKLAPIVMGSPTIVEVARAAVESGADGLTVGNTVPAMAVDVETRRPVLANRTGGLSGAAIHPITLRLVHEVHRGVARERGVPIIAAGGVTRWEDAAAYVLAGASAVQMGTALFADPRSPRRVVRGLAKWVRRQGAGGIGELVGGMRLE